MSTLLQKCGITNEIVNNLKKRGLFIPRRMRKSPRIMKSPSEEWFYYAADQFTPPLTKKELKEYIDKPEKFSQDFIKSLKFFTEVSGILYHAVKRLEDLNDVEIASATLAILHIFQSAMDYLYYKYDRHLEYHEYKDSPVGYYWIRLRQLCKIVADNMKAEDPERWAKQRLLDIVSCPRGELTMAAKYSIECEKKYNELEEKVGDLASFSIDALIKKLENDFTEDYERILQTAQLFYRYVDEFLSDCLNSKGLKTAEQLSKTRSVSQKAHSEVKSGLKERDLITEFEKAVNAIDSFIRVQEEETFIFYGITPQRESHVLNVGFKAIDYLNKVIRRNPNFVIGARRKTILEMLEPEDPPSRIVAARKVIYELEKIFIQDIKEIYNAEMARWT